MRYRFGACTLTPGNHTLEVDGAPVHVEPQVFDILLLLVRHPDRLVSHDQLMSEVWGGADRVRRHGQRPHQRSPRGHR